MITIVRRYGATTLALLCLFAGVGAAQETVVDRLSIHGYLTEAYGVAYGGRVLGLDADGTADYRRAAILARYSIAPTDAFVVQVAQRRLGDSPTMQFEQDLKLDMAFYQHRFANGTVVRVGKTVLPFGIFNETRYA